MSGADLSVVICAYTEQRWDDLRDAVGSVRDQQLPPAELILVIDYNEALLERARSEFSWARVMPNSGPKGLSGARNTGVDEATAPIVAFLDDDATAEADWTTRLLGPYEDPDVLGVGGWAVPDWQGRDATWLPEEFYWVIGCSYRGLPTSTATVRNLIGCNMSVRREVLVEVGGFDSGLGRTADRPLGCEETELCIRATDLRPTGRFVLEPAARVHHRVSEERTTWKYFRARCRAEGVSKAWVAQRVGSDSALSSERAHAARALPVGVLRHLASIRPRDLSGMRRAGAILAGLYHTAGSYFIESRRRAREPQEVPDAVAA
jgi:O-antigen biosynthesis protein